MPRQYMSRVTQRPWPTPRTTLNHPNTHQNALASGKLKNAYSHLIVLSSLNFKNKEDKQNMQDFFLIFLIYFIS